MQILKLIIMGLIFFYIPPFILDKLNDIKSRFETFKFLKDINSESIAGQFWVLIIIAVISLTYDALFQSKGNQTNNIQEMAKLKQEVFNYEQREINLKSELEKLKQQISEVSEKEKLINQEKDALLKKEEILLQKEQIISQREQELKLKEEKIIEKESTLLRKSNNNFDNLF